jgi:hypothetical protein
VTVGAREEESHCQKRAQWNDRRLDKEGSPCNLPVIMALHTVAACLRTTDLFHNFMKMFRVPKKLRCDSWKRGF